MQAILVRPKKQKTFAVCNKFIDFSFEGELKRKNAIGVTRLKSGLVKKC